MEFRCTLDSLPPLQRVSVTFNLCRIHHSQHSNSVKTLHSFHCVRLRRDMTRCNNDMIIYKDKMIKRVCQNNGEATEVSGLSCTCNDSSSPASIEDDGGSCTGVSVSADTNDVEGNGRFFTLNGVSYNIS